MKKLIFLLISLLPALATWAEVGDEFTVDGLKYEVTSEVPKTVELIYNEDENPTGELVIPATVNGYSVTSIGEIAFLDCSGLTSIEIPNSVTRIGGSAFWDCSSLISIEIPGSVTSIGSGAFEGCTSLTSIEIPDGVRVISGLFYNCSGLTSIVIPNSVAFIGSYTFDGCTSLTDVYCYADPAQLEWYYDAEEFMADKATKFHVSDVSAWSSYSDANVTFVGDIELEFHVGDEFTLGNLKYKVTSEDPKTVELIGYCASYLTGELVIPTTVNGYSVTSIGESAFY